MSSIRCLGALALVLALAPAAIAQTPTPAPLPAEPERLTLTPFIGLGFAGDYEDNPTALGVALGYGLAERVVVEGDLYFAPDGEQSTVADFDTSLFSLSANILYNFTADDFTPYAVVGLGFMSVDTNFEDLGIVDDDTQTKLVWNWGGGVKTAVSDAIGLRADLRYFNGDELVPDHWRLVGGVVIRRIGR
ncbi:MAG: outer membrane protein [Vicinamibacterales bacterium]